MDTSSINAITSIAQKMTNDEIIVFPKPEHVHKIIESGNMGLNTGSIISFQDKLQFVLSLM